MTLFPLVGNFCRSAIHAICHGRRGPYAVVTRCITEFTTVPAVASTTFEVSFSGAQPILRASLNLQMFIFATILTQGECWVGARREIASTTINGGPFPESLAIRLPTTLLIPMRRIS